MPCSAMMKFSASKGGRFSCGWPPPALAIGGGVERRRVGRGAAYAGVPPRARAASTPPLGDDDAATLPEARSAWTCAGISPAVSVCVCLAAGLADRVAAGEMHRRAALQVGQREGDAAVAAVLRAQQREQRLVLVDRQQLAVAQGPAARRERETREA